MNSAVTTGRIKKTDIVSINNIGPNLRYAKNSKKIPQTGDTESLD